MQELIYFLLLTKRYPSNNTERKESDFGESYESHSFCGD